MRSRSDLLPAASLLHSRTCCLFSNDCSRQWEAGNANRFGSCNHFWEESRGNSPQIIVLLLSTQLMGSCVIALRCTRASFQLPCSSCTLYLPPSLLLKTTPLLCCLIPRAGTEGLCAALCPSPLIRSQGVLCHPWLSASDPAPPYARSCLPLPFPG